MTNINPYENAKKQLRKAYKFLDYPQDILEQHIFFPDRIIEVNIPVKMDDGSIKSFVWYRSQHKNTRWAYKWWIRFHPDVSRDEVIALSIWMSFKTAVVDIPLWWWKWWIILDPKELSIWELERLSRWYVRALYKYLWADFDVPAPDVNTNPQIMGWMMDEYSLLVGKYTPWVITWKPLQCGGSLWRDIATALGWMFVLEKYFEMHSGSISGKKVIIQWAGNAWLHAADLLIKRWATIVWISDSQGWIYDERWLDIEKIKLLKNTKRSVIEYWKWITLSDKEILYKNCDILLLAALEDQIDTTNANQIDCKLIIELANWPISPDADEILYTKWIVVLPDILANAWWVTVSYFEQVQNNTNFYWSKKEVNEKLEKIMKESTLDVINEAKNYSTYLRNWAYIKAFNRILDTMKARWEI